MMSRGQGVRAAPETFDAARPAGLGFGQPPDSAIATPVRDH